MERRIFKTTIGLIRGIGVQQTRHFRLDFAPGTRFDFRAGQYLFVHVPAKEKTLRRPYSIASPPSLRDAVELCWKKVEGPATDYLWKLREGDTLEVEGPAGTFHVKEPAKDELIFISTGTGIAPLRAMMRDLLDKNSAARILNLFGCRYESDILYRQEFETLARTHPNFRNLFTVSKPEPGGPWQGETAYVQHLLAREAGDPAGRRLYICGLRDMVKAVSAEALRLGYTPEQINYERYT